MAGIGSFDNVMRSNLIQAGTISDVAPSLNDPFFINHHTRIDSIFKQWLQQWYLDSE